MWIREPEQQTGETMEEAIRGNAPSRRKASDDSSSDVTGPDDLGETLLSKIGGPADLEKLDRSQLTELCRELRDYIIDVVSKKGGHLGASLGVVELTVALETVLDLPEDKIVWDTGHQAYVHKVLTGRRESLWTIRQQGGVSGFLKRDESPYDSFGAGHASTAISAALGLAASRDLAGKNHHVVAVIGDGAMTGGLAYEALNNAGQSGRPLLVVLNDNGMSIAPNVGAMAHYLTHITSNPKLKKLRDDTLGLVSRLPALGEHMEDIARRLEGAVKNVLVPGQLFQALGFNYFGPVDGHDLNHLLNLLPKLLERDGPVLLHVMTKKGKGLPLAEAHHEGFHGVTPFDKVTGKALVSKASSTPAYTKVFGEAMVEAAEAFPGMVAITAAMPSGTGLDEFKEKHPDRFFDVGIAEAHAVCFAAGLACDGARPVTAIYSTFLQRAFDQIVHDVALQKLPVVFAIDRAGLVGADGPTHHGVLDLSYLRCIPGMVVSAPKDGNELRDLLWTGLKQEDGPFAVRYPRGSVPGGFDATRAPREIPIGSWEVLHEGSEVAILAVGTMVPTAVETRERLRAHGVEAGVVNCRFVKPMDAEVLRRVRERCRLLVTVEENNLPGGFGDGVLEQLDALGLAVDNVIRIGLPDRFVSHGTRDQLLAEVGLTAEHLESKIRESLT
jgi:1-deoxy-D-xylulose-5-phosphate synthase